MAFEVTTNSCALRLSIVIVAILTLQAFASQSAARPLVDKSPVHDDVMTSAEMQTRYIRPDGAVEAEIESSNAVESDHKAGIVWNRGGWNEKGGWDEGGNWDKGGGWSNRPPWAKPVSSGKQ